MHTYAVWESVLATTGCWLRTRKRGTAAPLFFACKIAMCGGWMIDRLGGRSISDMHDGRLAEIALHF